MLRPWLQNRLRITGVFDLALEADSGGLYSVWTDRVRRPLQGRDIARRLPGWGAADDADVRLLVPDGAGFEAEMTDLATLRGRDVLVTPAGADLRVIDVPDAGGWPARDVVPVDRGTGEPVAWRVIRPRNTPAWLPPLLEARPDGRIGTRTQPITTPDGAVVFPSRQRYLDLVRRVLAVPPHPAVLTVAVDIVGGRFQTLLPDGTARLLDAPDLGRMLRPGDLDVRIISAPPDLVGDRGGYARLIMGLAAALERVVWPAVWPAGAEDDLVTGPEGMPVAWRAVVPPRPDGAIVWAGRASSSVMRAGAQVELLPEGRGLRSAGQSWQDGFGAVIAAATLFPGQFVVGLDVGPEGWLSLHYGAGLHAEAGADDLRAQLRDAGWRDETLLIVTRRRPADVVQEQADMLADELPAHIYVLGAGAELGVADDGRLQASDADGAPQDLWVAYESRPSGPSRYQVPSWFEQVNGQIVPRSGDARIRFRQGWASMRMTDHLDPARRALLEREPEPGLFDLLPHRNAQGELGFADDQGHYAPPHMAADTHEIRLLANDGATLREQAARLAGHYHVPVWVTPAGATVELADRGRLIARRTGSGEPVPWIQVMPDGLADPELPWYDTTSGMFELRQRESVVELRSEPGGQAYGITTISRQRYYRAAALRLSRGPAGTYLAAVTIDPENLTFMIEDVAGRFAVRPVGDLLRFLGEHGWMVGQAIVVLPSYERGPDEQGFEAVTDAYAAIADEAGVSVFFPGLWSAASFRYGGGEPAVTSRDDAPDGAGVPRWERRDPRGAPASPELVQDTAWLRDPSDTGLVCVVRGAAQRTPRAMLRTGVASPTAEMARAGVRAYAQRRSETGLGMFFVDVPLAGNGGIALVTVGGQTIGAGTGQVLELIRDGGYDRESQVLQFLAAPQLPPQYQVFLQEVQRVADAIGRDVYIVAGPRAAVDYDHNPRRFVARGPGGEVVGWRLVRPGTPGGVLAGVRVRVDDGVVVVGDLAEPPAVTSRVYADAGSGVAEPHGPGLAGRGGELAAYVRDGGRRADVITIAAAGLAWLGQVSAEDVGGLLTGLGLPVVPARAVRLVSDPPAAGAARLPAGAEGLLEELASLRGASVYLGTGVFYDWRARDLGGSWQRIGPRGASAAGGADEIVLAGDEVSGLLLPPAPPGYGSGVDVGPGVAGLPAVRAGGDAALPGYFVTDGTGVLVRHSGGPRVFGELVTFEPPESVEDYEDQYGGYQPGGLPVVVVGTYDGIPAASETEDLSAAWAGRAVADLGLAGQPVRLVVRPLDDLAAEAELDEWVADFAAEMNAAVYLAAKGRFRDALQDFTAEAWRRFDPDPQRVETDRPDRELPAGLAVLREAPEPPLYPQPRYVRDPVSGLLVPESLEENPLPARDGETERVWRERGASLSLLEVQLIVRDGRVRGLVLPGPGKDGPLPGVPQGPVPACQFVVVAHLGGRVVTGSLRRPGAVAGEVVPVPPGRMAELIGSVQDYADGMGVVFLVPGLGQVFPAVPRPVHYAQRVADLLRVPVEAITELDPPAEGLAARRRVFAPMRPQLEPLREDGLTSLSPRLREQAGREDGPASPPGTLEVALEVFEDGSLGLFYPQAGEGGRTYPVPARTIAAELVPVLAGRSFVIRPVPAAGVLVSQVRLAAVIAEVRAVVSSLTGGGAGLAAEAVEPPVSGAGGITVDSRPHAGVAGGGGGRGEMRERAAVAAELRRERLAALLAGRAGLLGRERESARVLAVARGPAPDPERVRRIAERAVRRREEESARARVLAGSLPGGLGDLPAGPGEFWARLAEEGWTYQEVAPDGNCLFASLEQVIGDRLERLVAPGQRVRDWLADHLAEDLRRYREGWGEGGPPRWAEQLGYGGDVAGLDEAGADRRQHEEWVRQVRTDGVWDEQVGDLWPRMVAELTGPLIVLEPGLPPVRLAPGLQDEEPRYLIRVGSHYSPAWAPGTGPGAGGLARPLPAWEAGAAEGGVTAYQVAWLRLFGRRVAPVGAGEPGSGPGGLFAALAGRAGPRVAALLGRPAGQDRAGDGGGLRELVALRLIADLALGDSQYGGFLAAAEREEVIERVWTAGAWDDNTAALAVMIAADVLERPVAVIGPDAASSASYGQSHAGPPVEFLLLPGGQGRYLPAEPLPAVVPGLPGAGQDAPGARQDAAGAGLGAAPDLAQVDGEETASAERVRVLLGAGHQATAQEITRVVRLARSLGMPAGAEARWLSGLARQVGLHKQDAGGLAVFRATRVQELPRLFGLLVLAASVFDGGGADEERLVGLRRLADLIRAARRAAGGDAAEVTLADLQAEYRRHHDLGAGVPVSMRQVRDLVDLVRQAKELAGHRPVTREQLAALIARGGPGAGPIAAPSAAGSGLAGAAGGGEVLAAGALGPDVVYAGSGGGGAQVLGGLEWLGGVNPLRGLGGEFVTNCVLASIAVDLALAEREGFRAGAAGLREVGDLERYAGRPLVAADGFGVVVAVVRGAGPGARGMVSFLAAVGEHEHVVNVAVDVRGRVVFVDGQAGGLAVLPAAPVLVRFVLTAWDRTPPEPLEPGRRSIRWSRRSIRWNGAVQGSGLGEEAGWSGPGAVAAERALRPAVVVPALPGLPAPGAGPGLGDEHSAGGAGLGELDADVSDRAWGELPAGPALDAAVRAAQDLVAGYPRLRSLRLAGPGQLPAAEIAIRRIAAYLLDRPGDLDGAAALARALADQAAGDAGAAPGGLPGGAPKRPAETDGARKRRRAHAAGQDTPGAGPSRLGPAAPAGAAGAADEPAAPDAGQLAVLAAAGLDLVPVPGDGDCLMHALIATGPGALGQGTTPAQVRQVISGRAQRIIDDPGDPWHQGTDTAIRDAIAQRLTDQAFPGGTHAVDGLTRDDYYQDAFFRSTPASYRGEILAELDRPGDWAGPGGDIAPFLAAQAYDLSITVIGPGGDAQQFNENGTRAITLVRVPGHWYGTAAPLPGGPRGSGALIPLARELTRARRAHSTAWADLDHFAADLGYAVAALDRALASIQASARSDDARLARNLRAAAAHYARTGTVNAPRYATVPLAGDPGGPVNLGSWVSKLRVAFTGDRWARPVLDELGMRWATGPSTGPSTGRATGRATGSDGPDGAARLGGLAAALAAARHESGGSADATVSSALETLDRALRRIEYEAAHPDDAMLAGNLRAAAIHYARTGNVNATRFVTVSLPGDPGESVSLGRWLGNFRAAGRDPRWGRPVLDALGMRWATLPRPGRPPGRGNPDGAARSAPAARAAAPPEPAAGPSGDQLPGGAGAAERRLAPVLGPPFAVTEALTELVPQRVWRHTFVAQGAAQAPLGEDEDARIYQWSYVERRLRYLPEIDTRFPWRDPADPHRRAYRPFAREDGSLDPELEVVEARMPPPAALQAIARDPADRRLERVDWALVRRQIADEVAGLVRAAIAVQAGPPRIIARILAPGDLMEHEAMLAGQHGAFLAPGTLDAAVTDRPLLRNGRVLGLYAGAVLETQAVQDLWDQEHAPVAGQYTVDVPRPSRTGGVIAMGAEGYSGAAGFANTRLLPGTEDTDETFDTGVNAALAAVNVLLSRPGHEPRWQPILALVGLDNLYGDHNPAGMVLIGYGPSFSFEPGSPEVKAEPSPDSSPAPDLWPDPGPVRGIADAAAVAAAREELARGQGSGPVTGPGWDEYCVAMTGYLAARLYPGGITAGGVRDDILVSAGDASRRFLGLPAAAWVPVASWAALAAAVGGAGPGAAAFAVTTRPGGIGHALALVCVPPGGVVLVSPTTPPRPGDPGHVTMMLPPAVADLAGGPDAPAGLLASHAGPLTGARAVIVSPGGQVITAAGGSPAPAGAARALIDPPGPRVGAPRLRPRRPAAGGQPPPGQPAGHAVRPARDDSLAGPLFQRLLDELGVTPVNVRADGDCFFHSVILMFGDELAVRTGLGLTGLTADRLRLWLAEELQADFALGDQSQYAGFFPQAIDREEMLAWVATPGAWSGDQGDYIPQVFALLAAVPMTVIGPVTRYQIGPEGLPPEHYIVYDGSHYRGGVTAGPVLSYQEVQHIAAGILHQDRYAVYQEQYALLRDELAAAASRGRPGRPRPAAPRASSWTSSRRHSPGIR